MAPLIKIIPTCLLLVGCGSFQLASNISDYSGRTRDQVRLDILDCKDEAKTFANSGEKQVRAFMLGLTIIGTPVAYAADRADQRSAFRDCMESRGYRVAEAK